MANIEELDRALKWIEENPEQHDQSVFAQRTSCGTAMCLAGVVAMLNGWTPIFRSDGYEAEQTEMAEDGNGERGSIPMVAMCLLDLGNDEADRLFASTHDLDDLKRLRDELAETGTIEVS